MKTVRRQRHRGSNPLLSAEKWTHTEGVGSFFVNGIRTGAVVNDMPVACQSRDPACAGAQVESLTLRCVITVAMIQFNFSSDLNPPVFQGGFIFKGPVKPLKYGTFSASPDASQKTVAE